VSRGLALIAEGELDGDEASVEKLAERLGVGARQLRRLFHQHLGASPIAVAQTRRVLFAKQLIHDTRLPMSEIAMAAGFGSVRRFNETFRKLFGRPPGALRRKAITSLARGAVADSGVTIHLRYRRPYDWAAMLAHLGARTIDGVEQIDGGVYRRTILHDGRTGTVEIVHVPEAQSIAATIRFPCIRALPAIVRGIRRVFDLGADVATIGAHLARDPLLAPLLAARPGLRVPGGWDAFEVAVRAVLGQQVSVDAGCRIAGRLARLCGGPLSAESRDGGTLDLIFPTPLQIAAADLSSLGMPAARKQALVALARAAIADPVLFQPLDTIENTAAKLCAIPGIGEWTAHYIALRGIRDPDAFPANDIGLLRGAAVANGRRPTSAELKARADRWRPWRAYAAQHLWTAGATPGERNVS
jgi:AraC family transcriptional regulator of adaptative response / DNA-3-methyladenine glycosylase II